MIDGEGEEAAVGRDGVEALDEGVEGVADIVARCSFWFLCRDIFLLWVIARVVTLAVVVYIDDRGKV